MKKFKDHYKISTLLRAAAKSAKGMGTLYCGSGRCLWGEAAHLVGVSDDLMAGRLSFPSMDDLLQVSGAQLWDEGNKKGALTVAIKECGVGATVEDFKDSLREIGWLK